MILRSIARRRFGRRNICICLSIQSHRYYSWLLFLVAGAFLTMLLVVWTHIWNMRGSRIPFEGRTCFSRMLNFFSSISGGKPPTLVYFGWSLDTAFTEQG